METVMGTFRTGHLHRSPVWRSGLNTTSKGSLLAIAFLCEFLQHNHYICISTSIDTYMPIWHNIISAYFQLFSSLKKVAYPCLRVEKRVGKKRQNRGGKESGGA